ncbi:MAG: response regulator [Deltaproteobacteria bacterium]|nr:response regulator [Deltaproteobacteria bacterium]
MGKTILIVDDSAIMRKMIKATLQAAHHEVIGEAKDGSDAVELYKQMKPDLVTMDITMRGMDGLAAAEKILAFDSQAKIIFLSNLNEVDYTENARSLGAKGYFNKHSTEEILRLIEQL